MRYALAVLLLLTGSLWAADITVVVKSVDMETGAYSNESGGHTYTWHSMLAEVDGVTYKLGPIPQVWLSGFGYLKDIPVQCPHCGAHSHRAARDAAYSHRLKVADGKCLPLDSADTEKLDRELER